MLDAVMRQILRHWFVFALITFAAVLVAPPEPSLQAQDGVAVVSAETCAPVLQELWTNASAACINKPSGYVCNGGAAPAAEPSGLVSNALSSVGALVDVGTVDAIRTPPITTENASLGVAWLRLPDPLERDHLDDRRRDPVRRDAAGFPGVDVQLDPEQLRARRPAPPHRRTWSSFQSETYANIAVNGSSLTLGGTVLVTTDDTEHDLRRLIGAVERAGAGSNAVAPGGRADPRRPRSRRISPTRPRRRRPPSPIDPVYVANLPVALFDRPFVLPQPGFATTQGAINLRVAPDVCIRV